MHASHHLLGHVFPKRMDGILVQIAPRRTTTLLDSSFSIFPFAPFVNVFHRMHLILKNVINLTNITSLKKLIFNQCYRLIYLTKLNKYIISLFHSIHNLIRWMVINEWSFNINVTFIFRLIHRSTWSQTEKENHKNRRQVTFHLHHSHLFILTHQNNIFFTVQICSLCKLCCIRTV